MPVTSKVPSKLLRALENVPVFKDITFKDVNLLEIGGGQHNDLYRLCVGNLDLAIRLSTDKKSKQFFVEEMFNHRAAAKIGLATPIIHFNLNSGLLIYKFIDGERLYDNKLLNAPMMKALFTRLKQLHTAPLKFNHTHDPVKSIRKRMARMRPLIKQDEGSNPIFEHLALAEKSLDLLERHPVALCPIHGDMILNNVIQTPKELIFIDWQLSGMGDPHEEVANLLDGCNYSMTDGEKAIEYYLEGEDEFSKSRIILHWFLISIYWILRHEELILKGKDIEKHQKGKIKRIKEAEVTSSSKAFSNAFFYLENCLK